MQNLLIQGDNCKGMAHLLEDRALAGKVDLVYIDPPFATNNDFTVGNGRAATISKARAGELAYSDKHVGQDFIEYLRQRLLMIKELLSKRGSIYLHIDYKIGHYVKVMMDEVFGARNFRNDIARVKCNPKNFRRIGYGNVKDLILFYTKDAKPIWNEPKVPYDPEDIARLFPKIDSRRRRYTTVPIHAPGETKSGKSGQNFKGIAPPVGRHWRTDVATLERWDKEGLIEWSATGNPRKIIFANEAKGKRIQDIWEFKDPQYPRYPTEKNAAILDVIIQTSSARGSIVLDCFCGSGTTLVSAQSLGRNWIGIDKSAVAIKATVKRLQGMPSDLYVEPPEYAFLKMSQRSHVDTCRPEADAGQRLPMRHNTSSPIQPQL